MTVELRARRGSRVVPAAGERARTAHAGIEPAGPPREVAERATSRERSGP